MAIIYALNFLEKVSGDGNLFFIGRICECLFFYPDVKLNIDEDFIGLINMLIEMLKYAKLVGR
jgi:hypothetical protein